MPFGCISGFFGCLTIFLSFCLDYNRILPYLYPMNDLIALLVIVGLYLLPSFMAYGKKDFISIAAVNVLFGWTFLGWGVAIVWALKDK